jgi:hypothetical protein
MQWQAPFWRRTLRGTPLAFLRTLDGDTLADLLS